jgi:hypothetical protein
MELHGNLMCKLCLLPMTQYSIAVFVATKKQWVMASPVLHWNGTFFYECAIFPTDQPDRQTASKAQL